MKRKLLSVLLALVLVVSLAVPALALNDSSTTRGTYRKYGYVATLNGTDSVVDGAYSYDNYNAQLDCTVKANIYMEVLEKTYYNYGYGQGFVEIYAYAGNTKVINGTTMSDEINAATLYCYLDSGNTLVATVYIP